VLSVDAVSRSFSGRLVLDQVTFDVPRGAITGFVGGNGAGKTTTMRIILGVLAADGGQVRLDGSAVTRQTARSFGYMPEERGLYPKMAVVEQIAYLARLHGFTGPDALARAVHLLDRLGLAERVADPVENLSLGNQQRAQIAAALVHDPTVLILDEPFSGLDPIAVDTVSAVLKEHAAAGAPVLFSSHQLDLVERLCDNLVIIAGGQIKAAGSRAELQAAHAAGRYAITATGPLDWIETAPGVSLIEQSDQRAVFTATAEDAQTVLAQAVRSGTVLEFGQLRPTLAEVFRDVIADEVQEEAR
jgi:ABC-2 type transport system ATP-binding protein